MGAFLVYAESNALHISFIKLVVAVVDTCANVELHVVHEADPSCLPDPHNAFDQDVVAAERLVGADIAFDRDLPKLAGVLKRLFGLSRLEVGPSEVGVGTSSMRYSTRLPSLRKVQHIRPDLTEPQVVLPMRNLASLWRELFPAEQCRLAQLLIER